MGAVFGKEDTSYKTEFVLTVQDGRPLSASDPLGVVPKHWVVFEAPLPGDVSSDGGPLLLPPIKRRKETKPTPLFLSAGCVWYAHEKRPGVPWGGFNLTPNADFHTERDGCVWMLRPGAQAAMVLRPEPRARDTLLRRLTAERDRRIFNVRLWAPPHDPAQELQLKASAWNLVLQSELDDVPFMKAFFSSAPPEAAADARAVHGCFAELAAAFTQMTGLTGVVAEEVSVNGLRNPLKATVADAFARFLSQAAASVALRVLLLSFPLSPAAVDAFAHENRAGAIAGSRAGAALPFRERLRELPSLLAYIAAAFAGDSAATRRSRDVLLTLAGHPGQGSAMTSPAEAAWLARLEQPAVADPGLTLPVLKPLLGDPVCMVVHFVLREADHKSAESALGALGRFVAATTAGAGSPGGLSMAHLPLTSAFFVELLMHPRFDSTESQSRIAELASAMGVLDSTFLRAYARLTLERPDPLLSRFAKMVRGVLLLPSGELNTTTLMCARDAAQVVLEALRRAQEGALGAGARISNAHQEALQEVLDTLLVVEAAGLPDAPPELARARLTTASQLLVADGAAWRGVVDMLINRGRYVPHMQDIFRRNGAAFARDAPESAPPGGAGACAAASNICGGGGSASVAVCASGTGAPGAGAGTMPAGTAQSNAPPTYFDPARLQRSTSQLANLLLGFFSVAWLASPASDAPAAFLQPGDISEAFFARTSPMRRNSRMRTGLARILRTQHGMHETFVPYVEQQAFMTHAVHFQRDAIAALRLPLSDTPADRVALVTVAALRLRQVPDTARRVGAVIAASSGAADRTGWLLDIARAVVDRSESDLIADAPVVGAQRSVAAAPPGPPARPAVPSLRRSSSRNAEDRDAAADGPVLAGSAVLTLEDLDTCANAAITSFNVLKRVGGSALKRLEEMLRICLRKHSPRAWLPLFLASRTVAFFLKYADRENLPKAYDEFRKRNAGNELALRLIDDAHTLLPEPLVRTADLDFAGGDAALNRLLSSLDALGADADARDERRVAARLSAAWMRNRKNLTGIPMGPRNAQLIAFLMVAQWLRDQGGAAAAGGGGAAAAPRAHKPRSFIGQMATGEGKSLVTSMLAVYACTVLNKRVIVLENNAGLMDRDYDDFEAFYKGFGLTVSKGHTHSGGRGTDVTYVLMPDLHVMYQDAVEAGDPPFHDAVLVVDEVDRLIVDENPNHYYVCADAEISGELPAAFAALRDSGGRAGRPATVSEKAWRIATGAHGSAAALHENAAEGFMRQGGDLVLLNRQGNPTNLWTAALEYKRFELLGKAPKHMSLYFAQSTPHMLACFDAIVGLSGSLGSPAERDFLRDTFGASFFEIPSFLDTCSGYRKRLPAHVDGRVIVAPDSVEQGRAIARLAIAKMRSVPVLVIAGSAMEARRIRGDILAELRRRDGPLAEAAETLVQLFLQVGEDGRPLAAKPIVSSATAPVKVKGLEPTAADPDGTDVWRITITEYWGGRGHDYAVTDERIDDAGGLLVIATEIPESEREWIQWKGRTARNDSGGQLAVVLNAAEAPVAGHEELLTEHAEPDAAAAGGAGAAAMPAPRAYPDSYRLCKPSLVEALLAVRDVDVRARLDSNMGDVRRGQHLNELCDRFYARFGSDRSRWPLAHPQRQLRDLLESGGSDRQILDMAVSVRLAGSHDEYKAASRYDSW